MNATHFQCFVQRAIIAIVSTLMLSSCGPTVAPEQLQTVAQPDSVASKIRHVVVVVQEGRTLGNLFAGWPGAFAPKVGERQPRTLTRLREINYADDAGMCELYACMDIAYAGDQMDGFNENWFCQLGCATFDGHSKRVNFLPYSYMNHAEIAPYRDLAERYVLSDEMYMTSWSGDFSSHLDLVSGSTMVDPDHAIVDVPSKRPWGCDAPARTRVPLEHVARGGVYPDGSMFPCITQYPSMADSLDASDITWKYYVANPNGPDASGKLWNAFDAFKNVRYGPDWHRNITSPPTKILDDAASGNLPQVSWVIPEVTWSDHPSQVSDKGPSWVAAIVNAIGEGPDWSSTAIVVVWSDWGGWFDAQPPPAPKNLKGTGLGFRVPCLIISPYAKHDYVQHRFYAFGSILRFIEQALNVPPLSHFGKGFMFTDESSNSIEDSFDFTQSPSKFAPIAAKYPASYFKQHADR
jgi:phospholipase C